MIKHIVLWRLKDEALGRSKEGNARKLKADIEALADVIPEIQRIEVGLNWAESDQAGDVALYSEFATREDLATYQNHPAHQAVVAFVKEIVTERRVVDYN